MGTFIADMSSWTTLTGHTRMETAFETKNIKKIGIFIIKTLIFKVFEENEHLKKYSAYQQRTKKKRFYCLCCVRMNLRIML